METLPLVLSLAAVAVGATVQASVGFGMAMIAAPLLMLIDPRLVPGPLLAAGFCLTVLMTRREWRAVEMRTVSWAVAGGVPGSALGARLAAVLRPEIVGPILGVLVLVAVGVSVLGRRVRPTAPALVVAGAASGLMATLVSMGGPPLALLYQDEPGAKLRGTMAAYFTISIVVALTALGLAGRFGPVEWLLALPLVPVTILGYLFGGFAAPFLDRGATRIAVLAISGLAGCVVIVRYLVF